MLAGGGGGSRREGGSGPKIRCRKTLFRLEIEEFPKLCAFEGGNKIFFRTPARPPPPRVAGEGLQGLGLPIKQGATGWVRVVRDKGTSVWTPITRLSATACCP